ncbi:MAG: hypothetical protein QHJ73_10350, partial [Armatimonadota bacterium]|nr:hypothetical protein [Armatimonadota bacterium]
IFGAKRVAMFRLGRWGMVKLREFPDLDLGVCPLPYRKQRWSIGFARVSGINRKSPVREECLNFLKFLASREYNEQINRSADSIAAVKRYCYTDLFLRDPRYPKEWSHNKLWRDLMEYTHPPEVSPYISAFRVDRILNDEVDLMVNGVQSPAQAMRKAAAQVNKELQQNLQRYPELRARYYQKDS